MINVLPNGSAVLTQALPPALTSLEVFSLQADGSETLVPHGRISSGEITLVPVHLMEGADGAPEVTLRGATTVKQYITQLPIAEVELLQVQHARKAAAATVLRQLREALPRNATAIQAAVAAAKDGSGDLLELGTLTYEQHRIQEEIERQEETEQQCTAESVHLQALIAAETAHPRYQRRLVASATELALLMGHANRVGAHTYTVRRKNQQQLPTWQPTMLQREGQIKL